MTRFYQVLFNSLLELKDQQPPPAELKFVEVFNILSHNKILIEIFNKFTSSSALAQNSTLHESFIKLFKFLRITNFSQKEDVNEAASLIKRLRKQYAKDKTHYNTVLMTIKSCFRLNLACINNDTTHKGEIFDVPLVSTLEDLCAFLKEHELTSHYESLAMGINFYLRVRNITKYEEFAESSFYKTGLAETPIVIYALLLVNSDIGSKHFKTLLPQVFYHFFCGWI